MAFVVLIRVVVRGVVGAKAGHVPFVNLMLSIAMSLLHTPIAASICNLESKHTDRTLINNRLTLFMPKNAISEVFYESNTYY